MRVKSNKIYFIFFIIRKVKKLLWMLVLLIGYKLDISSMLFGFMLNLGYCNLVIIKIYVRKVYFFFVCYFRLICTVVFLFIKKGFFLFN